MLEQWMNLKNAVLRNKQDLKVKILYDSTYIMSLQQLIHKYRK
jgi:hypothetical protein